MRKIMIFIVIATFLTIIIGAAAFAEEWRSGNRWQRGNTWSSQTAKEPEADSPKREARDFSDEETFFNRMAAYCGRMMAGRYYEGPRRDGNGGDSSYRCH